MIVQTNVAAEVHVLHIGSQELALELDRSPATHAHTDRAASVVHVVYAVTDAVALQIAEQPAVTLHPADAFVFHSRAVADRLGASVRLRGLAAQAEVVVATLVFGSVGTELEAGYRAMAADKEREAEALQWGEATID